MKTKTNIRLKYIHNVVLCPGGGSIPPLTIRIIHDSTYTNGINTHKGRKPNQKNMVDASS